MKCERLTPAFEPVIIKVTFENPDEIMEFLLGVENDELSYHPAIDQMHKLLKETNKDKKK